MKWRWTRRGGHMGNGADEARTAASEALSAAHERSDEVARVTGAARRQAERSRRYLAELDRVYHLGRGAT